MNLSPLRDVPLADHDDLDRETQVTQLAHQPNSLKRGVVDLGLDYQQIDVAACPRATGRVRSEEDHARARSRRRKAPADLDELFLLDHVANGTGALGANSLSEPAAVAQRPGGNLP